MQVFETECKECGKVKYPYLRQEPAPGTYVCVLCRMVSDSKRATRKVGAAKRQAAKVAL